MSYSGPSPLNAKNHGCGYQGGPCNCAQCITFPHLPYKCIPFQQQLYTHRVRTNIHRTPTNYRELIMNTIPLKQLPGAQTPTVASGSLTAEETGRLLSSYNYTVRQSQNVPNAHDLKAQEWGTGSHATHERPLTPNATTLLDQSHESAPDKINANEINVGTVLNPLDFEYKPPCSRTSRQRPPQPLATKTETQAKADSGLCLRQSIENSAETDDVRENCTTMFDPYCATHDGRDRTTRKFGPNATILKYPRYPNHPENVFKPGYSEWRRDAIQPTKRDLFVEPPKPKRCLSEWERQQRREQEADEARAMFNNFSSGINSFKASALPMSRCRMDMNDVSGKRAALEYLPVVSTACRFTGCNGPNGCS